MPFWFILSKLNGTWLQKIRNFHREIGKLNQKITNQKIKIYLWLTKFAGQLNFGMQHARLLL